MALRCRSWGALPEAGGILDQPAGLLDKMANLLGVYESFRSFNQAKGGLSKWIKANPEQFKIVWETREMMEGN